jgi:hypothetical protein
MARQPATTAALDIGSLIVSARGQRVILDADLARIYGVPTKRLNEQVKRNAKRFPPDFMFRLTDEEVEEWRRSRSQFATLKRGQNIKYLPLAFTEHGALMAANVLNSERAVEMSVYVIRAFVRMHAEFAGHQDLVKRLAEIERTLIGHDGALRDLYAKLRPLLLAPPVPPRRRIGFLTKEAAARYQRRRVRGV